MLLGFVAVMGANLMDSLYISQVGTLAGGARIYLSSSHDDARRNHGFWRYASSVVARKIGAHDWTEAKRLMSHAIWMVIGQIALHSSRIGRLNIWLLRGLAAAELHSICRALLVGCRYRRYWLTIMRAAGDVTKPGYLMTFSAVIQIVLARFLFLAWALGMDWACRARRGRFWWRAF